MQNLTYSLETSVPVFQLDFFKQLANCEWENIMNNFTWHSQIIHGVLHHCQWGLKYLYLFISIPASMQLPALWFMRLFNLFHHNIIIFQFSIYSAFEPCLVCYFVALHCTSWEAVPSCRCVLRWKHSCSFALHFEDWGKHVWKYLLFCFELFWNKSLL